MRLIGMLDSPYVRRTALTLAALDIPFSHEPLSVFRHYNEFAAINPVCQRRCNIRPRGGVKSGHAAVTGAMARALTR